MLHPLSFGTRADHLLKSHAGQAHVRTVVSVCLWALSTSVGLPLLCSFSLFLIFLFRCWKATSINSYLPKRSKCFLLNKDYGAKLWLPVQIQTSKKEKKLILLEKEWKLFDSFRTSTDERETQRPFLDGFVFYLTFWDRMRDSWNQSLEPLMNSSAEFLQRRVSAMG